MERLNLRRGDLVEVRGAKEILATLDPQGRLDGLPFMPEMLPFCGQQLRVAHRADKTCDTIESYSSRRMYDTVHLEDARCDGSSHGGCKAGCPFFWNEAWLKRAEAKISTPGAAVSGAAIAPATASTELEQRLQASAVASDPGDPSERVYMCQATELVRASEPLPWWDQRQYMREVTNGNVRLRDLLRVGFFALLRTNFGPAWRIKRWLHRKLQGPLNGPPFIFEHGTLKKTPLEALGLQPGDRVRVKPFEEIRKTLNHDDKNRGLKFDSEMLPYCGTIQKVRTRVERIIEEPTGRVLEIPNACVILEEVICRAECSKRRLFCPRALYPFWREVWLEKLPGTDE